MTHFMTWKFPQNCNKKGRNKSHLSKLNDKWSDWRHDDKKKVKVEQSDWQLKKKWNFIIVFNYALCKSMEL